MKALKPILFGCVLLPFGAVAEEMEITPPGPTEDPAEFVYDYGDVAASESAVTFITLTSTGESDLDIYGIHLVDDVGDSFSLEGRM